MEPSDLILSKLGAGREKDLDFARSAAALDLVREYVLLSRIELISTSSKHRELIAARVRAVFR
jgi:hypothetical protein